MSNDRPTFLFFQEILNWVQVLIKNVFLCIRNKTYYLRRAVLTDITKWQCCAFSVFCSRNYYDVNYWRIPWIFQRQASSSSKPKMHFWLCKKLMCENCLFVRLFIFNVFLLYLYDNNDIYSVKIQIKTCIYSYFKIIFLCTERVFIN